MTGPRIASLLASATEIVCALGARDRLVARSHECDFPADVAALPAVTAPKLDTSRPSAEIDRDVKRLLEQALSVYRVEAEALRALDLTYLLTIGGDDTAFGASQVARALEGRLGVVHVPKTIDNDLPLPPEIPTFGFTTAVDLGKDLVRNLMKDAATAEKWFFVMVMGRHAGHLALGIGGGASSGLGGPAPRPGAPPTMSGAPSVVASPGRYRSWVGGVRAASAVSAARASGGRRSKRSAYT